MQDSQDSIINNVPLETKGRGSWKKGGLILIIPARQSSKPFFNPSLFIDLTKNNNYLKVSIGNRGRVFSFPMEIKLTYGLLSRR